MLFTIFCIFWTINKQKQPFTIVTHSANVVTDVSGSTATCDLYDSANRRREPQLSQAVIKSLMATSLFSASVSLSIYLFSPVFPRSPLTSLLSLFLPVSFLSSLRRLSLPFEVICWALLCSPPGTSFLHWRCLRSFYEVRTVWKIVSVQFSETLKLQFIVRGQRKV